MDFGFSSDRHYSSSDRQPDRPRVIPGNAIDIPRDVEIYPSGSRAGHDDRLRAIAHIDQMHKKGYLTAAEAEKRIAYIDNADRQSVISQLTSDLPSYTDTRGYFARWDWSETEYWLPVSILGMIFSAAIASVVPAVLGELHQFPGTPAGLAGGLVALVMGIIGFFVSLGIIIGNA